MAILKDALQGIWHHKVRSLLVLVLCFTVAAEAFQFFCVNESTQASLAGMKHSLATEVCIRFTYSDKTAKDASGNIIYTPIDSSTLAKLAELPHVAGHNYLTFRGTQPPDELKAYEKSYPDIYSYYNGLQQPYNAYNPENPYLAPTAVVDCVNDTRTLGEFTYGGAQVVQGRAITQADKGKNVIMVQDEQAKMMKWKIGDTITMTGSYKKQGSIQATIMGFYKRSNCATNVSQPNNDFVLSQMRPDTGHNPSFLVAHAFPSELIYAPYGMMDNAFWQGQWNAGDAEVAYYYIDDPKNVSAFVAQANKTLKPGLYSVSVNDSAIYDRMTANVSNTMGQLRNSAIISILIGAVVILLVCLISTIRRKGNFELLLKENLSRRSIAARVVLEALPLMLFAFLLAGFIHGSNLYDAGEKTLENINSNNPLKDSQGIACEQFINGQYNPENIIIPSGKLKNTVTPAAVGEYALLGLGIFAGASVLSAAYVFTFRVRGKKDEPASAEEQPQTAEQNIKN